MADETPAPLPKKRRKAALLIPALILMLGLGGGGFFLTNSKNAASAAQETTTTTQFGSIIRLKPITLNLSDGRVLKVGLALALVSEPKEHELALIAAAAAEGGEINEDSPLAGQEAKALNLAIQTLGDYTFEDLSKPGARMKAKEALVDKIKHEYHGDIVNVFYTEFVMA